jgi:hypothetical protein
MSDWVNSLFCLGGAVFILFSILKVRRDKQIKGISWAHVIFFHAWGWWNLFFFAMIGEKFAFACAVVLVVTEAVWINELLHCSNYPRGDDNATV